MKANSMTTAKGSHSPDTLARVATILGGELACNPTGITAHTTADDVDGWDSLAHARLIMKIEEVFDVRFPGDRLFDLDCVGDLVALVNDCTRAGIVANG